MFNDNNYWGQNDRNVFRTNFVRRDGHSTSYDNHWSCYGTYYQAANASYWQNDVCVDSVKRPAESEGNIYTSAVFYSANTGKNAIIDQMIGINEHGFALELEASGSTATVKNSSFYMNTSNTWHDGILSYASNTYENLIINGAKTNYQSGIWQVQGSVGSFRNNIIYNNTNGVNSASSSYSDLYNNGTNYANASAGTGNTTVNPQSNGLRYPVRIESGSYLATAGYGGGRLGPEILYKIGRIATSDTQCGGPADGMSCTLYGEAGWNELQDGLSGRALAGLWPFPNEDIIKTKLAAYSANGISGARGFCAGTSKDGSPQTLTKYIWEYLGNTIPSEVYAGITPPPGNQSPVANAGVDETITDSDNNGYEQVVLDASASFDADGTITSYIWTENGNQVASGVNASVNMSTGTHVVTLTVTDNAGAQSNDTVLVTINPYSVATTEKNVNFEPSGSPGVTGYDPDSGLQYTQARSYGWVQDISSMARARDINTDLRLDTFVYSDGEVYTWQAQVPNGSYLVTLTVGDAEKARGNHKVVLQGEVVVNASTQANQFITVQNHPVTVTNGMLTLQIGGGTPSGDSYGSTCLNYLEVRSSGSNLSPPPNFRVGSQ